MSDVELGKPIASLVLGRLVARYEELAETCYRVSTSRHGERGRFLRGHRARAPHPALAKKIDLDRELARIYARFFDPSALDGRPVSISISNSRPQGSVARTQSSPPPDSASSWEA